MNPEIIKEEKDYLVINKPAGLLVHPDGKEVNKNAETLCNLLLEKYPEISGVGEPFKNQEGVEIQKPGIVHRLDRETSGVMLVARTKTGFEYFKQKFQDREIQKTYQAFVYGNIKKDSGLIDSPIGKSRKNFRQWFSGKKPRGTIREAITEFKVLARSENKEATFVEVYPKTGRTHQIRVHFKSIYHPIVADSLYAPDREALFGFGRTALHSKKIEFVDLEGKNIAYEVDYPEDFFRAITNIGI